MEMPGTTTHQDILVRQNVSNPDYVFIPIGVSHMRKDARASSLPKYYTFI